MSLSTTMYFDGVYGKKTIDALGLGAFDPSLYFYGIFDPSLEYHPGSTVMYREEIRNSDNTVTYRDRICVFHRYHKGSWNENDVFEIEAPRDDVESEVEFKDSDVFECKHCGGTSTEIRCGKRVCAYCGSEII